MTFARPAEPCYRAAACGFTRPLPSPDGRRLAYWSGGVRFTPATLFLARADGTGARTLGAAQDAAWAPDSRRLAYSAPDGVHVLTTTGVDRIVDPRSAGALRWSPDGKTLAFVAGSGIVLRRGGRERVLVSATPSSFAWSPNGRRIAYGTQDGILLVGVASGRTRRVYRPDDGVFFQPWRLELAFSPNGRLLAFAFGGEIRFLVMRTLGVRTLRAQGHDLAWSPDGRSLLYVQGSESSNGDAISTGDVQTVTPSGTIRTVVSAASRYGGQIVAAAWVTPARGVRYRAPQQVDGVFAGGPVQELVADGAAPPSSPAAASPPGTRPRARRSPSRVPASAARSTAVATSTRSASPATAWPGWRRAGGLCFQWAAREARSARRRSTSGLRLPRQPAGEGVGTAVGAGSLLVMSAWKLHNESGSMVVYQQTVERVEPGGCPCPSLSSIPGPHTPLDVDAGRIVVSGLNETRILAADGTILLSLRCRRSRRS